MRCAARPSQSGDRDGDGILDNVDKCPDEPEDKDGFEDEDGCPDPDNDKDGIADTDDKCPNEPEDKDGFEDEDGCPDPDNDADGLADAVDKCPNEPEDKDGFEDDDGCPDPDNDKDAVADAADKCPNDPGPPDNDGCPKKYQHIVVTQEKIELKQKIFFDTNKATIQPRSFSLLDEIGNVLKSRPTMTVRIEGHTDSRGTRPHNLKLSAARADSVRQHLVGLGIESLADGIARVTALTSRWRPTRRRRGVRRTGASNFSSPSDRTKRNPRQAKDDPVTGVLIAFAVACLAMLAAGTASAQDQQAAVEKLVQMNKKALDDYDTLEWDAAKRTLLDALIDRQEGGAATTIR